MGTDHECTVAHMQGFMRGCNLFLKSDYNSTVKSPNSADTHTKTHWRPSGSIQNDSLHGTEYRKEMCVSWSTQQVPICMEAGQDFTTWDA